MSLASIKARAIAEFNSWCARDPIFWPARTSWFIARAATAVAAVSTLIVLFHSAWGHGQVLGSGGIHALPGAPPHEFWCVVVMASFFRASLFALVIVYLKNQIARQWRDRQARILEFQQIHGFDSIARAAFAKEQGGVFVFACGVIAALCLIAASAYVFIPLETWLPVFSLDNDRFLWMISILLFLVAFFALLGLFVGLASFAIAWGFNHLRQLYIVRRETQFAQLPQAERDAFELRMKTLGLQPDDSLRRAAVSSYKERQLEAQVQAEQLDQDIPSAPSQVPRQRL